MTQRLLTHNLMAIDPGLQGTGFAIWHRTNLVVPRICGVLRSRHGKGPWLRRVDDISTQVLDLCVYHSIGHVVCEMMEMHQSARAKMAWGGGDLQRTLVLIGTIHGLTRRHTPKFTLTPPSEWKGQLPKSVTISRVRKCLGKHACIKLDIKTHAWDAVGIGLWHLGEIS